MDYISTPAFKQIAYRKEGMGPVLVLLHGFPENGGLWDEIVSYLSGKYTVLAPDLPGSGESLLPDGGMLTMEQMADAIYSVLEAENVGQAVIAGHSMGGYVGLAFAEKYPEKIKGLSLVHSNAQADPEEKKEQRRKVVGLIQKGGKDAFIKQMIPNLFAPGFLQDHPEVIERQVIRGQKLNDAGLIAFYEAMIGRTDKSELLRHAAFPVQWIVGSQDSLMSWKTLLPQTIIADVNLVHIYQGCGHMSMMEAPSALQQDLSHFAAYCFNQ